MRTLTLPSLVVLPFLFACFAVASPTDPLAQPEIDHLLSFVKTSDCVYIRNGDEYKATAAEKHIRRKYKHYADEINSTEDFIRLSASRSALTGKDYQVKCPHLPMEPSSNWLMAELKRYRSQ